MSTQAQDATCTDVAVVPEFGPFDALSDVVHGLYVDGFADRAVEESLRWQPFVRQAGDGATLRYLLYTQAISLQQVGRYAESVSTARELLTVVHTHETVWRAKALALVAEGSTREGNHRRALSALAEADWLVSRVRPGSYGHLSANMAVALALRSLNLFEEADQRLSARGFRVTPELHLFAAQELAELSVTWAVSLELLGDTAGAATQLHRTASRGLLVQRLARTLGNRALHARGLVFEGFALHRLGLDAAAESRIREASDGFDHRPELVETHLARLVEAHLATLAGDPCRAREVLAGVIETARAARRDTWLLAALEYQAEVDVAEHGASESMRLWRSIARGALRTVWEEREARFDALRDREAIRRLTAHADRLGRAALQDPLTGLGNRRLLQATLDTSLRAPSVVFIDIDEFKEVNDRYSHAVGDDVLRRVSHVLRAQCRAEDVVVRYGGDEFLVLTSEDEGRAESIAQRVHRAVRDLDWSDLGEDLTVTVSVGVGHPDGALSPLAAADGALLEAKRRGRDQVVGTASQD